MILLYHRVQWEVDLRGETISLVFANSVLHLIEQILFFQFEQIYSAEGETLFVDEMFTIVELTMLNVSLFVCTNGRNGSGFFAKVEPFIAYG